MGWLLAIALAGAAFALAAFVMKIGRPLWTGFAAALALGLAGYAMQASPALPGAPAVALQQARLPGEGMKAARQEFIARAARSNDPWLLTSDAFAARGRYTDAANLLRGTVARNPADAESWLALAMVLVEHAEGSLTEPALFALNRAGEADPGGLGPGYVLGVTLLRQGAIGEGRAVWAETLANAREDAEGRALLAQRLAGLDALLRQAAGQNGAPPPPPPAPAIQP